MGACETLNPAGIRLLVELNAPFTDEHGNRLAPLTLVLETYGRNPQGKHEILEIFAQSGYDLPDTPIMAFHRGDVSQLEKHLRRDPKLLERRFTLGEIYPSECGCANDGRSGMHWTPIDGSTLLHMAIDFREREIGYSRTAPMPTRLPQSIATASVDTHHCSMLLFVAHGRIQE
jgi:hypothetical protein